MSSNLSVPVTIDSAVPQGVAPLIALSNTLCANLNAQFLNGNAESFYRNAGNLDSGRAALARLPTSATANRFLKVGAANTNPIYAAITAADVTSGVFDPARLGSETPNDTKFLRGDGKWWPVTSSLSVLQFDLADDASISTNVYTLTHNVGNLNYMVDYISSEGATEFYKGVPGTSQRFPDIVRIDCFANTVNFVYAFDPSGNNPPVSGQVKVRIIPL
jgi:hypothetical protein